jgi:tripartite-type tricarboxylate transporter receptor subunit TctC
VIDQLNREINAALALPDVRQPFLDLGITATGSTPEALAAKMAREITRWKEVIETSKIEKQ